MQRSGGGRGGGGEEELTLPQLGDGGGDELHGEADQVVFGALAVKLLWSLQRRMMNFTLVNMEETTGVL